MRIPRSRIGFASVFIAVCGFLFAYPVIQLGQWLELGSRSMVWATGIGLWLTGFLGLWYSFSDARMVVRYFMVHWMGASFILATVVLVVQIVGIFIAFDLAQAALWVLIATAALIVIAIVVSHHLQVKRITLHSEALDRDYRVVQISDVHIGSRQRGFMSRIVAKINHLKPDFVVITGDLIDSSAVGMYALQPLADLNATTLFSIGNHERYADLDKVLKILTELGVKPLRQETHVHSPLQFIGIDDADFEGQVGKHLPDISLDADHFDILLYHRPQGWDAAIQHGVDLMLSGHTHNGQIFPFNWIVRQQFPLIKGHYQKQNSSLYVSTGTGTWGPLMRLGSLNEISCFDLVAKLSGK